jgi:hypothetical protein
MKRTSVPRVILLYISFMLMASILGEGCDQSAQVADTASGPATDRFNQLKPGMSTADVMQLIGEPTHKEGAASAALRAVNQRLAEFENFMPPAFETAASAPDEETDDSGEPPEGEQWLYGPYNNLKIGDTLILVEFAGGKLIVAYRKKVIRPPMK